MKSCFLVSAPRSAFAFRNLRRQYACSFVRPVTPIVTTKRFRHTYNFSQPMKGQKSVVLPGGARMVETDIERAIELLEWPSEKSGRVITSEKELGRHVRKLRLFYGDLARATSKDASERRLLKLWERLEPRLTKLQNYSENPWFHALVYKNFQVASYEDGISEEERAIRLDSAYGWRQWKNTDKELLRSDERVIWLEKNTPIYTERARSHLLYATTKDSPSQVFKIFVDEISNTPRKTLAVYAVFAIILFGIAYPELPTADQGPWQLGQPGRRRGEVPQLVVRGPNPSSELATQRESQASHGSAIRIEDQAARSN